MLAYAKPAQKKEKSSQIADKVKSGKPQPPSPNLTGIPDNTKTHFENLSGFSFDDVRVHYNSNKPAQLQAYAYTQGNQVHIAPGQEKHLGHELGHVVQQKQGRVKPTVQANGYAINNDSELERNAHTISKEVLQRKIVGTSHNINKQVFGSPVVQMYSKAQLNGMNPKKPGSPKTYEDGDEFIKRWDNALNSVAASSAMKADWDTAKKEYRIPVPDYRREKLVGDGSDEFIFITKRCKGTTFFKKSIASHPTSLLNWLGKNYQSTPFLRLMARRFRSAQLGDIQGFYERDVPEGSFEFIDITSPGTAPPIDIAESIEALPKYHP